MSDIEEYRKRLVCLVPRAEAISEGTWLLTSHEYSLCDCQVLEIFAAHDALAEKLRTATEALTFECGNRCAGQNPCNAREALRKMEE